MTRLGLSVVLGAVLVTGALSGCATTPEEQEAIRRVWAEREAERARECRRNGVGFAAGGCVAGGP
jgi:hypothetical protein